MKKWITTLLLFPALGMISCQEEDMVPFSEGRIVKEVLYHETKDSDPRAVTTYNYDSKGNLILKREQFYRNSIDDLIVAEEYAYDFQNRITEMFYSFGDDKEKNFFFYPDNLEKVKVRIGNNGDTLGVTNYALDEKSNVISEKYFKHENSSKTLKIVGETTYVYYNNGVIQSRIDYTNIYGVDQLITRLYYDKYNFDHLGNKISYYFKSPFGDGTSYFHHDYEGDLLVASYTGENEDPFISYQYDIYGRLVRTIDHEGFLISERFYHNNNLSELHTFSHAYYGGPKKTITLFQYE